MNAIAEAGAVPVKPRPRDGGGDVDAEVRAHLHHLHEVKQMQQKIFESEDVQTILNDKQLKDKTFLSAFTVVENNVLGLTNEQIVAHIDRMTEEEVSGDLPKSFINSKDTLSDIISETNLRMKAAQYAMHRLLDAGEFHTCLLPRQQMNVELCPTVPRCFKLDLREYMNPLHIKFKYSAQ